MSLNVRSLPIAACRAAALLCVLMLAGCQSAMSTPAYSGRDDGRSNDEAPYEWPLTFKAHQFGAFSYSTYGCRVLYRGRLQLSEPEEVLQLASDTVANYPSNLNGSWGPIGNFPPPAKVTWRSRDGVPHEAEVDMGEIFKGQLIRHNLKRDEVAKEGIGPGAIPEIILEVNDRTINVYMKAHISTRELQEPGNRYSGFRNDLIKVYSRKY